MYNSAQNHQPRFQGTSYGDSGSQASQGEQQGSNSMRHDFIHSSSKPYPTDDDDDFLFQNPSNDHPQLPYSTLTSSSTYAGLTGKRQSHNNDYELDTLNDGDYANRGLGPKAPLIASYTNESAGSFPHAHPYHYQEPPESDPFADDIDSRPLPRVPFQDDLSSKPQPALPDQEPSEKDRIRRNEKARIRQLRSRPRFHYSRLPYFTIIVTLIQVIVFIVELAKMSHLTGSAFQTKPYFNPMLGPSTYLLINMGARYVPCMQSLRGITTDTTIQFPCPNSTSVDTNVCSLSELCGLSGIPIEYNRYEPDQWYRIITPIFLHAGFLHIIFNLLLQVTMGASIERQIGVIKFAIIYLMSGIGGFVLGANFSPNGIASTGCSGALFGIVATNIIMFVYCGRKNTNLYGTKHYVLFIFIMLTEIVVSFVLGLLPGLDNFSHLGGFAMGLLTSILLLQDPFFVYVDGIITYSGRDSIWDEFVNNWNPFYNWESKIPSRVYMWFGVRAVCLVLAVLYMALLIVNFFGKPELDNDKSCAWCKYFNCIPVNGWCDMGEISVSTASTSSQQPSSTSSTNNTPLPTEIDGPQNQKRRQRRYDFEAKSPIENKNTFDTLTLDSYKGFTRDETASSVSGLALGAIIVLVTFHYFKKSYSKKN
ncbi:hypothetical protein PGUG_02754 [Meyerozyma guilliermondii ATCC 6260]|uniref:Rhomboid-type serine protease n=1 Tax=Meyerozyma guilliermondii (strain ATCC 6260 / CBS 566 / DSM 6381 / JCM 1539 / NBRC 10279 / NRRL Y-324) TaxID=294746 RepID=A5DHK3_PICGU|nr:uncharacterized protein PGUG_02754 [Meyerozyma guilliermondii ATCC 6260]EDK38656.2 hypothetical protein PGUG_02754 [Meyerozyma guilliermondii ATCC 6260]